MENTRLHLLALQLTAASAQGYAAGLVHMRRKHPFTEL